MIGNWFIDLLRGRKGRNINQLDVNMDKKTIYRSSVTGRIVSREYSNTHPKTTEKERVRVGKPKK